jgi:UDP-N-acetylglucosamine 2-epimerase
VTTEYGQAEGQITETLMALRELQMPAVMLWPNVDAGSEDGSRGMRKFRETYNPEYIRFYKNFPVENYLRLMRSAACLVGNSSAPIREGAFVGTPAVNIGSRQEGRERAPNVVDVGHDRAEIAEAIRRQLKHGPYAPAHLYGDGQAGARIADVLAHRPLSVQKRIQY